MSEYGCCVEHGIHHLAATASLGLGEWEVPGRIRKHIGSEPKVAVWIVEECCRGARQRTTAQNGHFSSWRIQAEASHTLFRAWHGVITSPGSVIHESALKLAPCRTRSCTRNPSHHDTSPRIWDASESYLVSWLSVACPEIAVLLPTSSSTYVPQANL